MTARLKVSRFLRQHLSVGILMIVNGMNVGREGRTGAATMGIYTQGGTVFTAATTDWSHGLAGGDAVVERITHNVLRNDLQNKHACYHFSSYLFPLE